MRRIATMATLIALATLGYWWLTYGGRPTPATPDPASAAAASATTPNPPSPPQPDLTRSVAGMLGSESPAEPKLAEPTAVPAAASTPGDGGVLVRVRLADGSPAKPEWSSECLGALLVAALDHEPSPLLSDDERRTTVRHGTGTRGLDAPSDAFARVIPSSRPAWIALCRGSRVIAKRPATAGVDEVLFECAPPTFGRIRFQLTGSLDVAPGGAAMILEEPGVDGILIPMVPFGEAVESADLAPGSYSFRALSPGHEGHSQTVDVKAGVHDLGIIRLVPRPPVRIVLASKTGEPLDRAEVEWCHADSPPARWSGEGTNVEGVLDVIGEGRCIAIRGGAHAFAASNEVMLSPNEDGTFQMTAPPGRYRLRGHATVGEDDPQRIESDVITIDVGSSPLEVTLLASPQPQDG